MNQTFPKFSEVCWTYYELKFSIPQKVRLTSKINKRPEKGAKSFRFITELKAKDLRPSYFRIEKKPYERQIKLTMLSTSLKGIAKKLVGRTIHFIEGVALQYYHPISLPYDPRDPTGRRVFINNEVDLPSEILENYELKFHEEIYGEKVQGKSGILCALVEREKFGSMTKLFFYERLAPYIVFFDIRRKRKFARTRRTKIPATKEPVHYLEKRRTVTILYCNNCGFSTKPEKKGIQYCRRCDSILWLRRMYE